MIEGCRIRLKKGLLVGPGKLGRPAVSHFIWSRPFHLFYLAGIVTIGLAFSAAAQAVATSFDAATSYPASTGDIISVVTTDGPEHDRLSAETQTFAEKPNRKVSEQNVVANPSIGVELICGFALFIWVQRFRNSLG